MINHYELGKMGDFTFIRKNKKILMFKPIRRKSAK
jgi:hypothetical protein